MCFRLVRFHVPPRRFSLSTSDCLYRKTSKTRYMRKIVLPFWKFSFSSLSGQSPFPPTVACSSPREVSLLDLLLPFIDSDSRHKFWSILLFSLDKCRLTSIDSTYLLALWGQTLCSCPQMSPLMHFSFLLCSLFIFLLFSLRFLYLDNR